jgi:hypothetical protein
MNKQKIEDIAVRIMIAAGSFVLLLAFAEGLVQILGHSLVSRLYAPSRMLEIGAVLFIAAVALLLRQIRDQLRAGQS